MTVGELIKRLSSLNQELDVYIDVPYYVINRLYNIYNIYNIDDSIGETTGAFAGPLFLSKTIPQHRKIADKYGLTWKDMVIIRAKMEEE